MKSARTDRNQSEIVRALRQLGCSVQSLAEIGQGCPDLLVGFRGENFLMEVKDGMAKPSAQKLTECEKLWHKTWSGKVVIVTSAKEAIALVEATQSRLA